MFLLLFLFNKGYRPSIPCIYSKNLDNLIELLLTVDIDSRPDTSKIYEFLTNNTTS